MPFSFTQVVSAFALQEDFDICPGPFFTFCLFLYQKNFDIFHVLLFGVYLCVFDNIDLPFLYTEKYFIYIKKNIKIFY